MFPDSFTETSAEFAAGDPLNGMAVFFFILGLAAILATLVHILLPERDPRARAQRRDNAQRAHRDLRARAQRAQGDLHARKQRDLRARAQRRDDAAFAAIVGMYHRED